MSLEVQRFNCPNCGALLDAQNPGRSQSLVCAFCRSILDLSQPPYSVRGTVGARPIPAGSPFQVGKKGTIAGESYAIIGRVRYRDEEDVWDEWLLLGAGGAYRWLSDSEDVGLVFWEPLTPPAPIDPATLRPGMKIDLGAPARVRSQGSAVIDYLEGELTWRASVGDRMEYAEAVAPTGMYIVEWTPNEVEFYSGRRLNRREIERAFGLASAVYARRSRPSFANLRAYASGDGDGDGDGADGGDDDGGDDDGGGGGDDRSSGDDWWRPIMIGIIIVLVVIAWLIGGGSDNSSGYSSSGSIRTGSTGRSLSGSDIDIDVGGK